MRRFVLAGTLSASTLLLACGEDTVNIDGVTNHACIHAEHGPFEMVVAGQGDDAPDVSARHTAFVIDLSAGGSQVTYQASEEAAYVFFVDKPATWNLADAEGGLSPFTDQKPGDQCEYFERARGFDLEAGATYVLDFAGTAEESVTVIVEAVDG